MKKFKHRFEGEQSSQDFALSTKESAKNLMRGMGLTNNLGSLLVCWEALDLLYFVEIYYIVFS